MSIIIEYLLVTYIQERGGYRFYDNRDQHNVTVRNYDDILPVLECYGADNWEFICWNSGSMIFKRNKCE